MKVTCIFCEYWFKTQDGQTMYKLHFYLDSSSGLTVYVPCNHQVEAGAEILLRLNRGKDGRCTVSVAS